MAMDAGTSSGSLGGLGGVSGGLTQNEVVVPSGIWPGADTDENEVPTDPLVIADRVAQCKRRARNKLGDWYEEARIDFEFDAGKQWSDEDIDVLKSENRIPVVFNRVAATVNSICGQEINNRQEVHYLPRRIGPADRADPLNDAVRWAVEQCNAEDENSDAFHDAVVCGMGWTVLRMDYESDPEGMIAVERRDPLTMRWDPAARRKNLSDAKWVQADYEMDKAAISARWPDADIEAIAYIQKPTDRAQPIDVTENWKYKETSAGGRPDKDTFTVTHHVERVTVLRHRALDPATGSIQEFTPRQRDTIESNYTQLPEEQRAANPLPRFVPVGVRVYWEAWVIGREVLGSGHAPTQKDFCYQCMTVYRERETGYWYGVVRMMRDPQRYANRLMSQMMTILGTGAKGGILFETGAFADTRKALDEWARPDSAVELNPGALAAGKIQPKQPVQLPQGASDLMQFAIASIRDVTGVNIELLGAQNDNETGVVEHMRTKAGLTILAPVFDAMRYYRKRLGVILADYVRSFISDGRLIRVLGPQGQQFIPLLRDPTTTEYDVIVDESPDSRDVKERTWLVLSQVLPLAMQAGMPMPDELLDYTPLPESLIAAWKQKIAQMQSQPPQPPLPLQIEQMKAQVSAQADAARAQADMQIQQQRSQLEDAREKAKIDRQAELERYKADRTAANEIRVAEIRAAAQVEAAQVSAGSQLGQSFVKATTTAAGLPAAGVAAEGGSNGSGANGHDSHAAVVAAQSQQIAQLQQHVQRSHMPKKIIRGPDGRAIAIQSGHGIHTIDRGPDGRVVGVHLGA